MQSDEIICEACLPDAQKVSTATLKDFLKRNTNWELLDDNDVQKLSKCYNFTNFVEAQRFTNNVAEMAEIEGHHPTIILEYGLVTVKWWSQKIKGLHELDITLSKQTDALYRGMSR